MTHVHLRKAKLMFFYTRYPSSAVLKSYFPVCIYRNKFNKRSLRTSTSTRIILRSWSSGSPISGSPFGCTKINSQFFFREFFYMQMEKYAKQAIAEGIRNRGDIFVKVDSEIYKQLNQHYNRNNVIQVWLFYRSFYLPNVLAAGETSVCHSRDTQGVLCGSAGGKRCGAFLEEGHIQGDTTTG